MAFKKRGTRGRVKFTKHVFKHIIKKHYKRSEIEALEELLSEHKGCGDHGSEEQKDSGSGSKQVNGGAQQNTVTNPLSPLQEQTVIDELIRFIENELRHVSNRRHVPYPKTVKHDEVIIPKVTEVEITAFKEMFADATSQIKPLRAKLARHIMTTGAPKILKYERDGDDIDDDAIVDFWVERDERVFTTTIPRAKTQAAVSLLCDLSGSMGEGSMNLLGSYEPNETHKVKKYYQAGVAMIAASETLHALRTPFRATGFTDTASLHRHSSGNVVPREIEEDLKKDTNGDLTRKYNRFRPNVHYIFKDWRESYQAVRYRLGAIAPFGANCDPEAIAIEARSLLSVSAHRRILIVISDGMPTNGVDTSILRAEMRYVLEDCKRAGIEVIGLGILSDAVRMYYENCDVVEETNDIAPKLHDLIAQLMKREFKQSIFV